MEPAGGVAWPARGGSGDGSSMKREIPLSPAWEPPLKKVRNNAFHAPTSTYPSQEPVNYARGDGQGGFSPSLSHHAPPVHSAGDQLYGGRESFGPFSHGQGMPTYGGQPQMQSSGEYAQNVSGRSSNMAPQSSVPTPGFPPGSAKGTGALFLKTKLCTKFKLGTCTFNERCHFAHGMEDLRKPPIGWETMVANAGQGGPFSGRMTGDGNMQQRKKSSKPCRFFADGKECPYGDRCTFVHVAGDDVYPASAFGDSEGGGLSAPRLKTRMCARWERGEACNYGERCHYAHGYAELQSDTGVSAYSNDNAPTAANKLQYSNASSEMAAFAPQFPAAKTVNALPATAPPGGAYLTATTNAPLTAYPSTGTVAQQPVNYPTVGAGVQQPVNYPATGTGVQQPVNYPAIGTGVQQPVNTFTKNQGYWDGTSAQGGFLENQTSGSWNGHPIAGGGYSKDPTGAVQYLPAQVQQPLLGQSYAAGNAGIYQDPKQSVNGIYQDSNQSVQLPYMQDGGSTNFQTEALGGNGSYYPATYLPTHPT